ncbi:MAG: hypothetical protein LRZ97_01600 [Candidatus Pacebacteria bacterium]|nr:hypothetical protein [Candidatus Paceibacterota bacterium]
MEYVDTEALKGVESVKAVFDVTAMEPKKLASSLMVIRQTVEDFKNQDVAAELILTFRGPALKFISQDRPELGPEQAMFLDKITMLLKDLGAQGVRMEACAIAASLMDVDIETMPESVTPVGNTFVSIIGYQAQGYTTVSV